MDLTISTAVIPIIIMAIMEATAVGIYDKAPK